MRGAAANNNEMYINLKKRGRASHQRKIRMNSINQKIKKTMGKIERKKKRGRNSSPRAARTEWVNQETEEKEKRMKQFQNAKDALQNFELSAKHIEQVLKKFGPPYTYVEAATLELQRRQNKSKTKEALEHFKVEIGMLIQKPFNGKLYEGIVICEVHDKVIKSGKLVKVWQVAYEDGDFEELDYDEVLRYRICTPDPARSNIRGRALQALELFCGSAVVSQEFRQRHWNVIALDADICSNATLVQDIVQTEPSDLEFVPDVIWASPPCHTYSCAAGSYHRSAKKGQLESSKEARDNNFLFCAMVKIMKWAKKKHPHLVVVIENPVGQLAHMPLMEQFEKEFELEKKTVHYCAFGRDEKKPTHIWSNDKNLLGNLSRYQCSRNCQVNGCHESVQANRNKIDYSVIPQKLAEEVAENLHAKFYQSGLRWEKAANPKDK
jgi:hypothetical protein